MDIYDELFEQMDIIRKMHENFREFVKAGYGDETLEKLEILGVMPERARSEAEAKVPALLKRNTCTLSDLKGLCAVAAGIAGGSAERVMSGKTRDSRAPKGRTGPSGDTGCPRL